MTVDAFVTIAVAVVASTGFWEFIKWILSNSGKKRKRTPEDAALLALLHDRLYELLTMYLSQDCIDADDYDNLIHLYNAYRELKGNGLIERMFKQVSNLPIKG